MTDSIKIHKRVTPGRVAFEIALAVFLAATALAFGWSYHETKHWRHAAECVASEVSSLQEQCTSLAGENRVLDARLKEIKSVGNDFQSTANFISRNIDSIKYSETYIAQLLTKLEKREPPLAAPSTEEIVNALVKHGIGITPQDDRERLLRVYKATLKLDERLKAIEKSVDQIQSCSCYRR